MENITVFELLEKAHLRTDGECINKSKSKALRMKSDGKWRSGRAYIAACMF
jgi:hypothetical protein